MSREGPRIESVVAKGQERILLAWQRLLFPGLQDRTDRQLLRAFGRAALLRTLSPVRHPQSRGLDAVRQSVRISYRMEDRMTEDEIRGVVLGVLKEIQSVSGREWSGLELDVKPIGTLDGFDSLSAVEATVMVEEKLGCLLTLESIFISEDGKRALTLKEIAGQLCEMLAGGGAPT